MTPAARVALIGYGVAGEHFHAPLVATTAGLELAAVVTADLQRQQRVQASYPGTVVAGGTDDLWSLPDLALCVVATPNATHVALAEQALARGLAVVVDKPLAVSAAAAAGLVRTARESGGRLTVFQNRRWDDDFLTARALIDGGRLGQVWRLESRFERWRPELKPGWRESGSPGDGGGVLADLGSHLVDQALLLFGPVESVYAELDARRPGAAVDDDAFVALTHRSGVRSHLWVSATAAHLGPRLRVLGSSGAFLVNGLDGQEAALRAGQRPQGLAAPGWGSGSEGRHPRFVAGDVTEPVELQPGDYPAFYRGVAAWLGGEGPAPVDPQDAVAVLAVLDAARRSAAEGRSVSLSAV